MKWLIRLLQLALGLVLLVVLFLVGSIVYDAATTQGRVAALTNTELTAADGTVVRAYVARPDAEGTYPAVLMIHEWWGLQENLIGKAEALADEGYIVIAPDTYRGAATEWIPRALFLRLTTPQERVNIDLDAVYTWLTQQPDVRTDAIGILGFCYGGAVSLRYSLTNPELAATVVLYGDPIDDPTTLRALPAPLLGIFGGADQQIPVEEVNRFQQALEAADIPHIITVYPDQPHAFVQSIEQIRQGGAQGEAWAEIVAFLEETLN